MYRIKSTEPEETRLSEKAWPWRHTNAEIQDLSLSKTGLVFVCSFLRTVSHWKVESCAEEERVPNSAGFVSVIAVGLFGFIKIVPSFLLCIIFLYM